MTNVTYQRTYTHQDWVDNQDIVTAGGTRGFNVEFHQLEQEFDNISTVVTQLNAGLGAFQPVGTGGAVAYTGGGNVGIGPNYSATTLPAHAFEVSLGTNTGPAQQASFGNAVCCNGGAAFSGFAVFSHSSHASDSNFAVRQGPNGNTQLNAAAGQPVSIRQQGGTVRLGISPAGNVIVGSEAELPGAPATAVFQVFGDAYKTTGGTSWAPSDARVKEDVRQLEAGLSQLRQVRPVRFRYNGRAGTPDGREGVGVLGQEIEKIFPEMIRLTSCRVEGEPHIDDFRIFDGSALTFVLINAVKELAGKVEQLEQTLAEARRKGPFATTS